MILNHFFSLGAEFELSMNSTGFHLIAIQFLNDILKENATCTHILATSIMQRERATMLNTEGRYFSEIFAVYFLRVSFLLKRKIKYGELKESGKSKFNFYATQKVISTRKNKPNN